MTAASNVQPSIELQGQQWKLAFPRKWLRILAVPWTLILIAGSLMGDSAKGHIGTHIFHRPFHFVSFGATAALYMLLATTAAGELKAALAATGLGLSLEALQHWIYGNAMEWWDVRDDAIGIGVALLIFRGISRWNRAR
jgi:hypothetical protein